MDQPRDQKLPPHKPPPPADYALTWLLWGLAIALVAYPLSIGPAIAIYYGRTPPRRYLEPVFRVVYSPLEAVRDTVPPAGRFLEWYVSMWRPTRPGTASSPNTIASPTTAPTNSTTNTQPASE